MVGSLIARAGQVNASCQDDVKFETPQADQLAGQRHDPLEAISCRRTLWLHDLAGNSTTGTNR
jgi:hypothetical protein